MAIDERRTSPERPVERVDREPRRGDWSTFWDDPLFTFWRDVPRRRAHVQDPWFREGRFRAGRGPDWAASGADWTPDIETFQRGDEFVVRADLPGTRRSDIALHATPGALTIEGERRPDLEDEHDGTYRSERVYGRFCRVVPLPESAVPDRATATFSNGVLEVVMKAPPREVSRGHTIEIRDVDGIPDIGTSPIYPE